MWDYILPIEKNILLLWIVPPSESCLDYLRLQKENEILLELVQISTLPALEACVIDLTGVFGIVLKGPWTKLGIACRQHCFESHSIWPLYQSCVYKHYVHVLQWSFVFRNAAM